MDTERRTIGKWLDSLQDRSLALPSFQRGNVWKPEMTLRFLRSIIIHPERPVGAFLVLETGSDNPIFSPRYIDKNGGSPENQCRELLLDGQQRLTALWNALKNDDENYRYYVKFDESDNGYKVTEIKKFTKDGREDRGYFENPRKSFKKLLFPACLLDPLEADSIVDKWTNKIRSSDEDKSTPSDQVEKINKLIKNTRKIFTKETSRKKEPDAYSIPYFKLSNIKDRAVAFEVYEATNTSSVQLSHYYLALAGMEKRTNKSLYSIAETLDRQVPDLQGRDLESDDTGELILKIFCLMNDKPPSGANYKGLPFESLAKDEEQKIISDGVIWAVEKLNDLKIWHGRQLPSTIPLRVLPALHQYYQKYIDEVSSGGQSEHEGKANRLINRYLWHTFLTNRYTKARVNALLHEDYKMLKKCFENGLSEQYIKKIPIFKEKKLNDDEIKQQGWPKSKSILARGILLACCQNGAKDPISGIELDKTNLRKRELHHIFPKSRSKRKNGNNIFNPHKVLNCLFISTSTNKAFTNHLPGTYLENIFQEQNKNSQFDEASVKNNLKTHNMSGKLSEELINVKDKTHKTQRAIKDSYNQFLNERTKQVKRRITKLLKDGEL